MSCTSVQFWATAGVVAFAPVFFGSVDLFWVTIWTIILSLGVVCTVGAKLSALQARILNVFFAVCAVYALVGFIQVQPLGFENLNEPIWHRANEILGSNEPSRISSRADVPHSAAGHFLLFVASFINGFFIGTSRSDSSRFILLIQYCFLVHVTYGLAAFLLAPHTILWIPKTAYIGNLTGTFINRNTAATFLGAGAILWLCSAISALKSLEISSVRLLLLTPSHEHLAFKIIFRAVAALVCSFALLLTGSRGGLICSCLGMIVAVTLLLVNSQKPNFGRIMLAWTAVLIAATGLLSNMGRIGSEGIVDDGRWAVYEFCLRSIWERPLFGAGIGTFVDLFPSMRADNFPSKGVWDYAHSTILEIAVEMGVPVAATIVIFSLAALYMLSRAAIKLEGRDRWSLAAIAGILVLTFLHSIIDFSLQIPGYLIFFGVLLGCGLARAASSSRSPVFHEHPTQP